MDAFFALQMCLNAFCLSLGFVSEWGLPQLKHVEDVPTGYRVLTFVDAAIYVSVLLPISLLPRICLIYFFLAFRFYLKYIRRNVEACMTSTWIPHSR